MNWIDFPVIAILSTTLLSLAFLIYFIPISKKNKILFANIFSFSAILLFIYFILSLWINLERPPLRTLGETRLWYTLFISTFSIITFNRWKYFWFLAFSNLMAIVFIIINITHPETYNKTLMPALQSPWFVPHVVVYILSYAILAGSWLVAVYGLVKAYTKLSIFGKIISIILFPLFFVINLFSKEESESENKILNMADNIVFIGFAFLTMGLLFGALWAKEAWGNYWTWDPKETWALLTFLVYLIYMHLRSHYKHKTKLHLWVLSISFIFLLSAWFGVNYMPSSKNSVHTYSSQE